MQIESLIATLTLLILTINPLFCQTNVSEGEITGYWQVSESPFIIEGNVTVPADGKLTIGPGVDVLFSGPYVFEVYGRIDATGTIADSIYFGMADTIGFSTNEYEGWAGMSFMNMSGALQEPSLLDYVKIEYSAGNGLTCYNSSLLLENSKIKYNKGYGLNVVEATDIVINDIQISYNKMGGVSSQSSAPFMSDFIVSHNNGSGILVVGNVFNNAQATFQHGSIIHNNTSGYGGGVNVGMDAYVIMSDLNILSNTAFLGGGIHCDMGGVDLSLSNVSFNVAVNGGGLNINGWSTCSINNTLVADNLAYQTGGGIKVSNSSLQMDRTTLAYNMAGETSGGIEYEMIEGRINTITNSILWENFPQEIVIHDAQPVVQYSDVMGAYEGIENLDADPLFVDADNSNYMLQWNNYPSESGFKSPAIDSGDPLGEYDPDGTIADLGAFYFEQTIFTHTHAMNRNFELSIYPNPVSESFSIMTNQEISKIEIINLTGQVIQVVKNIDLNLKVNISDLNKGIYLLNIYFENSEVGTETLIKN